MSSKHKRTKACGIGEKTKRIVFKRDDGLCIFCCRYGKPEAHIIPRSQGGLGVPQNIITVCRKCHDKLDNSTEREKMLREAIIYVKGFYPNWKREDFIFNKWAKDKGKEHIKDAEHSSNLHYREQKQDKSHGDKGEPPDGFRFL